jgi:hypothetical protein
MLIVQLVKKFTVLYGTQRFIPMLVDEKWQLDLILIQKNLVNVFMHLGRDFMMLFSRLGCIVLNDGMTDK